MTRLGRIFSASLLLVLIWGPARADFISMPATMQETLQLGVTAFTQGDYAKAAQAFDHLKEQFGKEPQYAPLVPTLLPIHGYACQMIERPQDAITLYREFLSLPHTSPNRRGFVLFSLAQAYQQNGDIDQAVATYQAFIETQPDSPEAVLSAMRQAELYFDNGQEQEGIDRLLGFAASERVPASLATQAQLRALQKSLELQDYDQATTILFDFSWKVDQMPELAVLTFSALDVGNHCLAQGQHESALRAYRLVTPLKQLIAAQETRLIGLQILWNERQRRAGRGHHEEATWNDYIRGLAQSVEAQLQTMRENDDFTPGFQLRLGQTFLLLERAREACIVFRALAEDDSLDAATRASAHYRWILAANALEDWDESLRIARLFLERFPDHPEAPAALFLIANAYQEKRDYAQALTVLTDLLDSYPEHRLAPRWLFSRGYNATLAQEYPPARADFARYLREYPHGFLAGQARLWLGMTYFFDRRYETALEQFDDALAATQPRDPVYPEVVYRRAQTLYSDRQYPAALESINDFLQHYAKHARAPEAHVLKGDILMGQGRLLEASNQFASVTPEAGPLFPYAVFQRGKIQQALGEYDLMVTHFADYVRRDDVPEKVRIAEALYWIAWAHQRKGEPAQAFPFFVEALGEHGDDPTAGETGAILQALHQLHAQYHAGEFTVDAVPSVTMEGLLVTPDFEQWLADQRDQAIQAERWTWLSRINLYRASLYRKRDDTDREYVALLEIVESVPMQDLDPEGLAQVGNLLAKLDLSSARDYFNQLLEEHPRSTQLGAAFYGLALMAANNGETEEAEMWLNRFETETPFHAAGPQVKLLRGELLIELGKPEKAVEVLEDILRLKAARGRPHANALLLIGHAYASADLPDKAIAYYQRVYTLYRAYPEFVAAAYLASAPLFEQRGDLRAAYNSWAELRSNEGLSEFRNAREQAAAEMARLEPILPPLESETVTAGLETSPTANEQEAPL
ncbi:MAG: tetratricopeptide repeat protein [Puniceicoccales bacterium]